MSVTIQKITPTTDITALSASDFGKLTATDLAALNKAQVSLLTTDQLNALPATGITAITTKLKYVPVDTLAGISITKVPFLPITVLTTDQLQAFDTAHLSALNTTQVAALGRAQLNVLSANSDWIHSLNIVDVKIYQLESLKNLSNEQISALTPTQVEQLTMTQIGTFTADQQEAFYLRKAEISNNKANNTDPIITSNNENISGNLNPIIIGDAKMTIKTITTQDVFDNSSELSMFSDLTINELDNSIESAIAKYSKEKWMPKENGSDTYDDTLNTLQTISFKSNKGSILTVKILNGMSYSSGFDFLSSDGLIKLQKNYSSTDRHDSLTGAGGNDIIETDVYTNYGASGKADDVSFTYTYKKNTGKSILDISQGYDVWNTSITSTYGIKYTGEKYKIDIATKSTIVESKFSSNEKITISKYSFINNETGFKIELTGKSELLDGYEKISLSRVNLTSKDYALTASNVSYNSVLDENGLHGLTNLHKYVVTPINLMQEDIMKYITPNLMNANNTITIKNNRGIEINAGDGNDSIIGFSGNDTIIGGLGSDKLTGGKGKDIFSFSYDDFFTKDKNGNIIYNNSIDTIMDFSIKDHDILFFGEHVELSFYATLKEAEANMSDLFYIKSTGKIYMNTDATGEKYVTTPIIILSGKPDITPDLVEVLV